MQHALDYISNGVSNICMLRGGMKRGRWYGLVGLRGPCRFCIGGAQSK